jgi:uncharacterized protein
VDGGTVELNGKALPVFSSPGSYLRITREWADGDRLEVKLPMRLHSEPLLGDPTQVAALYGPIVLAGRLGTEGLTEAMQFDPAHGPTQLSPPHAEAKGSANILAESGDEIRAAAWVVPVKGHALTFQTVGQKNTTMLNPLRSKFLRRMWCFIRIRKRREFTMSCTRSTGDCVLNLAERQGAEVLAMCCPR